MRLEHIKLRNIGPHRNCELTLGPGLVGVFGPQGSGKSTIFDACYAALTNDWSRMAGGVKDGAICQLAPPGEVSEIDLTLELQGRHLRLVRRLAPRASHLLEDGDRRLVKATEIEAELSRLLGGSRGLLGQHVFVRQWQLLSLFSDTPSQRAASLSQLCGTAIADRLLEFVADRRAKDGGLTVATAEPLDPLLASQGQHEARLRELERELAPHQAALLDQDTVERLRAAQAAAARRAQLAAELDDLRLCERRELAAAKRAVRKRTDTRLEEERLGQEAGLAAEALTAMRIAVAAWEPREQAWRRWRQAADSLDKATREVARWEALEPPAGLSAEETEELSVLEDRLTGVQASLAGLSRLRPGSDLCPTCGQSVRDLQRARDELSRSVAELSRRVQPLATIRDRHRDEATRIQDGLAHARAAVRMARSLLGEPLERPESPGDLSQAQQAGDEARAASQRAAQAAKAAAEDAATRIAEHRATQGRVQALEVQLAGLGEVEPGDSDLLARHDAAEEAVRGLLTERRTVEAELESTLRRIAAVREAQRRARRGVSWVAGLERAAAALHRDGLPRAVHLAALERLRAPVNSTLSQFEAPWRVTVDEERLSWTCHLVDGTVVGASDLSGGQQVVLSLGTRLRLGELFAAQIGMMVLDEPTAGLDARHVELLSDALAALSRDARSTGRQIVVITHEQRLESVFDQVVRLERRTG